MVLTDAGAAASDIDGSLIVINNFSLVIAATPNGGTIVLTNQVRVYRPLSTMGNTLDVSYVTVTNVFMCRARQYGRSITYLWIAQHLSRCSARSGTT
jgi:hypothetical protein